MTTEDEGGRVSGAQPREGVRGCVEGREEERSASAALAEDG